jgi:hypothetical protein
MDGEVFDGNEIIFCDKCNVPVHQMCYGVHTIPEGDWMCDVCAAPNGDPAKTTCELCSHVGGAYKVTDKGKWIHALCATWVPEVFVADVPQHPQPYTLQNLDKKRYKLKCALCNTTKGAAVQCSYGKCVTAVHPWCAIKRPEDGFKRRVVKNEEGETLWQVFCKNHAHGVTEPLKPKPKSKQMQQLAAAPIVDPAEDEERKVQLRLIRRGGGRRSGGFQPMFSMAHMVKKNPVAKPAAADEPTAAAHAPAASASAAAGGGPKAGAVGGKSTKKGRLRKPVTTDDEDDDDDEDIDDDDETVPAVVDGAAAAAAGAAAAAPAARTFPSLTLNEWPGQSENEAMDLDHFWNVASMHAPEDHSVEVRVRPVLHAVSCLVSSPPSHVCLTPFACVSCHI